MEDDLELLAKGTRFFEKRFARTLEGWRDRLAALQRAGGAAVIWGAGSKGVSFLTNVAMDDAIRCAVDINPHKHGKYIAGTQQQVLVPQQLTRLQPDLVIAMNAVYRDEIRSDLDQLGVECEVDAL